MILVYGATGLTGSLICDALAERGLPFCVSGRHEHRLQELARRFGPSVEARPAWVHDPSSLRSAMEGVRVVVSCAGPFLRVGEPVLAAAVEAGAHYLDTSGEQAFVRDVYERYESRARHAGVTVVNAFAFEVALGDFAAELASRALDELETSGEPADEVALAYAVDRLRFTPGTQLSIVQGLSEAGCVWREDRWEEEPPATETRSFGFPPPFGARETMSFPSADVITVPRHVGARRVQAYLSLLPESSGARLLTRAASLLSPALPALMGSPLGALARSRAGAARPPSAGERAQNRFCVLAEATRNFQRARVAVSGADVYAVSAAACALGAGALLERPPARAGVLAPSEAFEAEATLDELAARCGLEVTRS